MGFVGKQGVEPWVVTFVRAAKERQALLGREHLIDCEESGDDGGECCVGCLCCLSECVYLRTYTYAMSERALRENEHTHLLSIQRPQHLSALCVFSSL